MRIWPFQSKPRDVAPTRAAPRVPSSIELAIEAIREAEFPDLMTPRHVMAGRPDLGHPTSMTLRGNDGRWLAELREAPTGGLQRVRLEPWPE